MVQLVLRRTLSLVEKMRHYDTVRVICDPKWTIVEKITEHIEKQNIKLLKREVIKQDNLFHVSLVATFTAHEFQKVTRELLEMPEVHSLYQ